MIVYRQWLFTIYIFIIVYPAFLQPRYVFHLLPEFYPVNIKFLNESLSTVGKFHSWWSESVFIQKLRQNKIWLIMEF